MKTIKIILIVSIALFINGCSEESVIEGLVPKDSNQFTNPVKGSGQFSFAGQTISGTCTSIPTQTSGCTGINVLVGNLQSSTQNIVIYNMPTASSGIYNVNGVLNNCNPYAICLLGGTASSTEGTITKTGATSFTFSITMNKFAIRGLATGSGSY